MLTKEITYSNQDKNYVGYFACVPNIELTPLVLIVHDWTGRSEFVCTKARMLAEMGYAAFALDMYGDAVLGETKEQKSALMQPLAQDRSLIIERMQAGLDCALTLPQVDKQKIAAIGFCFGGLCVLDFARNGAPLKGVVSFHGALKRPENLPMQLIKAKVLALHGFDDPMVPPEQVLAFQNEMTECKADWQMHIYGNAMHAFTNPQANDPVFGTVYNQKADQRSAVALINFLDEIFVDS